MKIINNFLNIFKNNPIYLGRWSLKYDERIVNRIVYLANEDHCGCCEIKYEKNDEYYYPFVL